MMKNHPTLSIVIPAYNEEDHLAACLESIASQTVRPDEVIVVDNGSRDRTATVAKSYPFVRVVRERRRGLIHARNRGFDEATSDIIGRIDADSVLPSEWVGHVKSFYADGARRRTAWSGSGYFYNVRPARLVSWVYQLLAFRLNQLLLGHYTLWGSNMAVPRSQWRLVRASVCHRADIHEDLDLAMHIVRSGGAIAYDTSLPVPAELRRVHTDRHELWKYLQWWPRTLRVHGKRAWVVCWFFGALLLYPATFVLLFVEHAGRALERLTAQAKQPEIVPQDFSRD